MDPMIKTPATPGLQQAKNAAALTLKHEPPTRKFDAELLKKLDLYTLDVDVFTKKDSDKNGYLSSDEYGAGKAAQAEFARYDTDDDGKLTLDEYMAGKKGDRERPIIDWDQLPEFPPILRMPTPDMDAMYAK